jgi:pyrroloquinoline quinone (PQQ) biosynthesis protein C
MAPNHFYSGFNRYFYEHHLRANGYEISETVTNGDYSEHIGQELRRLLTMYNSVPAHIKICIAALLRFLGVNRARIHSKGKLLCYGRHIRALKL